VFESGVIDSEVSNVWGKIKHFSFEYWKRIKQIEVEEMFQHGEVSGIHMIHYADGTKEKVKLQVVSDRQFLLKYDVLETSSNAIPAGIKISHCLQLRKITYSNQTVIEFATKYSDQISLTKFIESKQDKKTIL